MKSKVIIRNTYSDPTLGPIVVCEVSVGTLTKEMNLKINEEIFSINNLVRKNSDIYEAHVKEKVDVNLIDANLNSFRQLIGEELIFSTDKRFAGNKIDLKQSFRESGIIAAFKQLFFRRKR